MAFSTIGFFAVCIFIIYLIFHGQSKSYKEFEKEQIRKVHEDAFIELGVNKDEEH